MNMTDILLTVSVGCNLWFLFLLLYDRIMRITRVIGHDRLSLSAYIDHVLTHHFNQCEEAIKSLYARNYDAVF